jgi:metal-dependent amidase/aminoacylase/carboxypeptidase family protein
MPIANRIADFHPDLTAWRQDIHAHPELGYEEHRTSELVATKLAEFGIAVHRGLAGTGVVGTLKGNQPGDRAIALRADYGCAADDRGQSFRPRLDGARPDACLRP